MERQIEAFIDTFVKELEEQNAAIFAGAGLSVARGYVNWRDLLKPIAAELGLDIDQEHDLISVAQYHVNEKQNRSGLNHVLIEQFSAEHTAGENHRILARLPIRTFWTTNYDPLIEDTLKASGKIADVKYTVGQLKHTKPKRDAIVYKMHGDVNHPDDAILTKDDYEKYHSTRGPFVTALSGDLVSKTFLFLGFSFTDPNLDYILSRVRISLHDKPRQHYCVFKKCAREEYDSEAFFNYAELKQKLAINDLKRFGVQTLLVENYDDITVLLTRIERRFKQKTVLISGSAHEFGIWENIDAEKFISNLSHSLVQQGCKIVSGFGLGVGSHVIVGALKEIYEKGHTLHDQLILRPFPQGGEAEKQKEAYRQDMVAHAGIALFLFGNKLQNGQTILADGMIREFEIAKEKGLKIIPVGTTGYVAEELWKQLMLNFDRFYPEDNGELRDLFQSLGELKESSKLIATILTIIDKLKRS